ncbi:MAG: carbohydrate kinase [Rhodobacteraceae bacterium]|nr:carbohydrate kinase [Paracoccaceae bacterium]
MILCCGEALVDMIGGGEEAAPLSFIAHPGGAIFNTAIALGRLGAEVGLLAGLSDDSFGTLLVTALAASNVDLSTLIRSDRPTTLAFVRLIEGQASYMFYDENTAGRMIRAANLPPVPDRVSALYFGGISLINTPCADTFCALALREAPRRLIMADPNIRPALIRNPRSYRARLSALLAVCDIVKLSDEDLDWLVPGPLSLPERARALAATGPRLVIVTQGAAGALAFTTEGQIAHVAAVPAHVVDTVGAGDTFNAGVLAHLARLGRLEKAAFAHLTAAEVESALHYGAQVAAVTVARAGANPPWRAELA